MIMQLLLSHKILKVTGMQYPSLDEIISKRAMKHSLLALESHQIEGGNQIFSKGIFTESFMEGTLS